MSLDENFNVRLLVVDCDEKTGLAKKVENFIFGGELKNSN